MKQETIVYFSTRFRSRYDSVAFMEIIIAYNGNTDCCRQFENDVCVYHMESKYTMLQFVALMRKKKQNSWVILQGKLFAKEVN